MLMDIRKKWALVMVAGALVASGASVASEASAGSCQTEDRAFPPNFAQDRVEISCRALGGNLTEGEVHASQILGDGKRVISNLFTGVRMVARGLSSTGQVICTATDTTNEGTTKNVLCPSSAVRWHGIAVYNN
jgi:hypothetical protein